MYMSLVIITPILICLWVYFLIVIRDNFFISASIELNIIDNKNIVTNFDFKNDCVKIDGMKRKMVHVPKFMLELYENNKIRGIGKVRPDVVRSLIPKHTGSFLPNEILENPPENHLLIFDIPSSDEDEKFISAELKILTLLDSGVNVEMRIRRTLKISIYDDSNKKLLNFQEIQMHRINNTWLSFDVTAPVNEILQKNTRSNFLKIVITVSKLFSENTKNVKLSLMPAEENLEHDYPVLILSYSSTDEKRDRSVENRFHINKTRRKRSIEDDYEEETNKIWDDEVGNRKMQMKRIKRRNTCKRKPLYIDFSEIKYDLWIVQPSGYDAYQCQGRCFYPVAEHLNPTKHAIVQALLHSVAPTKVSRSCCVPTILDPISILYVDMNGVLTYRYAYKDMVVVECGCR